MRLTIPSESRLPPSVSRIGAPAAGSRRACAVSVSRIPSIAPAMTAWILSLRLTGNPLVSANRTSRAVASQAEQHDLRVEVGDLSRLEGGGSEEAPHRQRDPPAERH